MHVRLALIRTVFYCNNQTTGLNVFIGRWEYLTQPYFQKLLSLILVFSISNRLRKKRHANAKMPLAPHCSATYLSPTGYACIRKTQNAHQEKGYANLDGSLL